MNTLKRDNSVDILKSIAIIGVIIIHTTASGIGFFQTGSANWFALVFWGSIIRFAVPIFFMCSGALLLNPEKNITIKKLYTKNILRIVLALFFWALAYEVFAICISAYHGVFSVENCIYALKRVLTFQHHFHLYFLHMMIIVYLFLPVTKVLTKHLDLNTYRYVLLLWILVCVIYPLLLTLPRFDIIQGIPRQWALNATYGAIGYTMLGDYINRYSKRKPSFYLTLFILGFLLTFSITTYKSFKTGGLWSNAWEGMYPTVLLMAYGLYGFIKHSNILKNVKFTEKIANASFCIFLVHDFFNTAFYMLNINISSNPFIMIPALSILNMALSFALYLILRRIPFVKTYLI